MAFRFAPRTVLELGKELISSDEVAIFELLKNAVDAGSKRIEIEAQIVITHSTYVAVLDALDGGAETKAAFAQFRAAILEGAPNEAVSKYTRQLGRRLDDPSHFRRAFVGGYARFNWIEVRDWGGGMSLEDLDAVFLTIGTRSRRAENVEGARFLGDKGVGRLSTMRLGERLLVTSTTADQGFWGRLRINWALFSHDSSVALEDINIHPVSARRKESSGETGTTVRISMLNADWSKARFEDVMHGRIARMVDPFTDRARQLLHVTHNHDPVIVPRIPPKLLDAAHAYCAVTFSFDENGEPILEGDINYRLRGMSRKVRFKGAEIYSMAQRDSKRRGKRGHAAFENIQIRPQALSDLGPFEARIYWFNRLIVKAIDDLTENQGETRKQIADWSGGPMLYRFGFRVLPYGDPKDDWLALDVNAFGESGFKLNRQQVIGRVNIHSSHLALSEQTNRQGLIESDAEAALKKMLMVVLHIEMRGLINDADELERITKREVEEAAQDYRKTQEEVHVALDELRQRLGPEDFPYADRLGTKVNQLVDQCAALTRDLNASVSQTQQDRDKFVHLAGIGLMTEFIFHELDRAVRYTIQALATARGSEQQSAMRALEEQLLTLQKRVSAFDELTGERRQTKSRFGLSELIQTVLTSHENQFSRHNITVNVDVSRDLTVNAVRGMLIQILENLIANSVYWLKQQAIYQPGFKPEMWISLDPELKTISVEDNGPGVDPVRRNTIFQPFVTSKPPGQGRGLGLYISRELATYHGWQIYLDSEEGRQRAGRLNMFVIDMGASK